MVAPLSRAGSARLTGADPGRRAHYRTGVEPTRGRAHVLLAKGRTVCSREGVSAL